MRRVSVVVASLLVAAIAMASTATAAQRALSKPKYIDQADSICYEANQLRDEVAQGHFSSLGPNEQPTSDEIASFVDEIEPIFRDQIDALRELPAPKADTKRVKKIYRLVEKAVNTLVEDPDVLLTGPDVFVKANKAAQKYGFQICGAENTD